MEPRIGRMRVAARAKLKDLRQLLGGDVTVARAALLRHVEKITLKPDGKAIVATGNWNLLGEGTLGWCRGPGWHHDFAGVSASVPFRFEVAA